MNQSWMYQIHQLKPNHVFYTFLNRKINLLAQPACTRFFYLSDINCLVKRFNMVILVGLIRIARKIVGFGLHHFLEAAVFTQLSTFPASLLSLALSHITVSMKRRFNPISRSSVDHTSSLCFSQQRIDRTFGVSPLPLKVNWRQDYP